MVGIVVVFFFKQKTAYEMRISDWSSDVCSSDLGLWRDQFGGRARRDFGAASDRNAAALCPDPFRRPGRRRLHGDDARASPLEIEPVRRCRRDERHGLRDRGPLRLQIGKGSYGGRGGQTVLSSVVAVSIKK